MKSPNAGIRPSWKKSCLKLVIETTWWLFPNFFREENWWPSEMQPSEHLFSSEGDKGLLSNRYFFAVFTFVRSYILTWVNCEIRLNMKLPCETVINISVSWETYRDSKSVCNSFKWTRKVLAHISRPPLELWTIILHKEFY